VASGLLSALVFSSFAAPAVLVLAVLAVLILAWKMLGLWGEVYCVYYHCWCACVHPFGVGMGHDAEVRGGRYMQMGRVYSASMDQWGALWKI